MLPKLITAKRYIGTRENLVGFLEKPAPRLKGFKFNWRDNNKYILS